MVADTENVPEVEPDYRFTFANERTFLAWQRTSLGLLAAAVGLVERGRELGVTGGGRVLGRGLEVLAILPSGMVLLRCQQADRSMLRGDPFPLHPSPVYLAVGLSLVGI